MITREGLSDARSLEHLISLLLQTVIENNAAVSASHENAVQTMTRQTEHDLSIVKSALTAISASTSSLQEEMVSRSSPDATF